MLNVVIFKRVSFCCKKDLILKSDICSKCLEHTEIKFIPVE